MRNRALIEIELHLKLLYIEAMKIKVQNVFVCFLSARPVSKGVEGLARVGSRAALSFAFAFLRRAWRSGKPFPAWFG